MTQIIMVSVVGALLLGILLGYIFRYILAKAHAEVEERAGQDDAVGAL